MSFNYTTDPSLNNFLAIHAHVALALTSDAVSASLEGDFGFSKATVAGLGSVVKVSATAASATLTVGPASVAATGITGAFVITPAGVAGKLTVGVAGDHRRRASRPAPSPMPNLT